MALHRRPLRQTDRPLDFVRANIRRMQGYQYGEQPTDPLLIKLNTNENPFPPSPALQKCVGTLDLDALRLYPNATASSLRKSIANHNDLHENQVVVTNGADEGIRLLFTTFLDTQDTVAVTDPGYTLYQVIADVNNTQVYRTELTSDWQLPSHTTHAWNKNHIKVAVLINPHAPTGSFLQEKETRKILEEFKGLLVLDEAYVDFVDPRLAFNSANLLADFPNLLILRTFSKGYSLAGLRVGYLLGSEYLIGTILNKTRDSYNVGTLPQQLAECVLNDQSYARSCQAQIRHERLRLTTALRDMDYRVCDSQANFLLVEQPNNKRLADLVAKLREQHILIRYFETDRLAHAMRVTIGTEQQNDRFLAVLRRIRHK